jgi:hypothetical protein
MTDQEDKIIPLSQRIAHAPPRWRWWLGEISIGGLVMLICILILLGGACWFNIHNARTALEAMQTPLHQGTALVKFKELWPGSKTIRSRILIAFEIDGHYVQTGTEDIVKWQRTAIGDTVSISYHIGKDGAYYVEDWQPPVRKQQISLPR